MNLLPQLASRIMPWLILIGVLLVLTAVVSILVFYVMFRRPDAGFWQHDVRAGLNEALGRKSKLRNELKSAARQEQAEAETCRERARQEFLGAIPVSELGRSPGIGPATVERLQAAGY